METKVKPYLEFRACWNNNWSEREWVWADGCDQDSRNRGMNQWGTGRHRVGCWSGWRGNYQAITLNRDMLGKYPNFAFLKFVLDWQFVLVLSWLLRCGSRVGTLQPRYMSLKGFIIPCNSFFADTSTFLAVYKFKQMVENISDHTWIEVMSLSSRYKSMFVKKGEGPRSMTTWKEVSISREQ